jgi:hypothetical protein
VCLHELETLVFTDQIKDVASSKKNYKVLQVGPVLFSLLESKLTDHVSSVYKLRSKLNSVYLSLKKNPSSD